MTQFSDTSTEQTAGYGAAEIESAELERWPNPNPGRDYMIDITAPEFTCLCPRSGYPDFATIAVRYVPGDWIVELRSLKLYVNRFRSEAISHEMAANRILDDLVDLLEPRWVEVVADFAPRGNVHTVVAVHHRAHGWAPSPDIEARMLGG
jgi:7-cyano-7-deazaguanine reductase